LDATYLPVLDKLMVGLSTKERGKVLRQFRTIVGSIIILASPLSTVALAQILAVAQGTVDSQMSMLHSVLSIPQSAESPVRLLHLSFRDFLLDSEKQEENPFWVDERATHEKLTTNCLKLLSENHRLREDICGLEMPGRLRDDVDRQNIDSCLPSEVQYACLYWVYHLKGSRVRLHDGHQALQFLQHHFLHWLEALSLIGRISESIGLIDQLQNLVDVSQF
ncbi:WD domain-containing protein, partial [Thelonectria olida]